MQSQRNEFLEPRKYEVIDGKIVMLKIASPNHTSCKCNILTIFMNYLKGKQPKVFSNSDIYLSDNINLMPDIMVVCNREIIDRNKGVMGAPDLVAEIVSPLTVKYDRGRKKDIYAEYGVKEYWIVDTMNRTIEVFLQDNGALILNNTHSLLSDWEMEELLPDERADFLQTEFSPTIFPDLKVSLHDVFDDLL